MKKDEGNTTRAESVDDDKHAVLDRFAYQTAYEFGEALAREMGWEKLDQAVQKHMKVYLRSKAFRHTVERSIRRTLDGACFQDLWAQDLGEALEGVAQKTVSRLQIGVTWKVATRGSGGK
ncbi:MAG: hypothetical protein ACYCPQ_00700 [Elusimicrobiota bacterium]